MQIGVGTMPSLTWRLDFVIMDGIHINQRVIYCLTSNRKGRCRGSRLVAWDKGEVQATPSGPAEIRIRKEIFYVMMIPLFRIDAYLPRA